MHFAQTAPVQLPLNWIYPVIVMGALMFALNGAAGFVANIASVWDRTRRKPPAEVTFATKRELEKLDERTRIHIEATNQQGEKRAQSNRDMIQEKVASMEKYIAEKIADNKTSNAEAFGAMRGELHAMRGTLQAFSNDMMRTVGRLEGPKAAQ